MVTAINPARQTFNSSMQSTSSVNNNGSDDLVLPKLRELHSSNHVQRMNSTEVDRSHKFDVEKNKWHADDVKAANLLAKIHGVHDGESLLTVFGIADAKDFDKSTATVDESKLVKWLDAIETDSEAKDSHIVKGFRDNLGKSDELKNLGEAVLNHKKEFASLLLDCVAKQEEGKQVELGKFIDGIKFITKESDSDIAGRYDFVLKGTDNLSSEAEAVKKALQELDLLDSNGKLKTQMTMIGWATAIVAALSAILGVWGIMSANAAKQQAQNAAATTQQLGGAIKQQLVPAMLNQMQAMTQPIINAIGDLQGITSDMVNAINTSPALMNSARHKQASAMHSQVMHAGTSTAEVPPKQTTIQDLQNTNTSLRQSANQAKQVLGQSKQQPLVVPPGGVGAVTDKDGKVQGISIPRTQFATSSPDGKTKFYALGDNARTVITDDGSSV